MKKTLGWAVDKRITLSLAGYYVTLEKDFDENRYREVASHLKKRAGIFSALRSHLNPLFVATLDVSGAEPEQAVNLLMEKADALKQFGFKVNSYTYLAALMMSEQKINGHLK